MNDDELRLVDGGFFPIVIFGITIGAEYVAAAFLTGVGIGAAVAQSEDHDD